MLYKMTYLDAVGAVVGLARLTADYGDPDGPESHVAKSSHKLDNPNYL